MAIQKSGGFSLISALVLLAAAGMIAWVLAGSTTNFVQFRSNVDRKVSADQVLVETGAGLQGTAFTDIINMCRSTGALTAARTGSCTVANALNPSPSGAAGSELEVLKNWKGDEGADGKMCIELTRCELLNSSLMLQVSLTGFWAGANGQLISRRLQFRRARW